ncbi:hypothetical protein PsorP6_015401 [Peronosclerospora sorghi]|uniref:Uncharacterized protein n=1 Tax=Peronosclerospora sorghi TaxID=230839 RepID=A0ACC0WNQ2_9STRA|nr:hypothetical protein PsorP6_015401 [Peronosclerospora sorghi]
MSIGTFYSYITIFPVGDLYHFCVSRPLAYLIYMESARASTCVTEPAPATVSYKPMMYHPDSQLPSAITNVRTRIYQFFIE